MRAGAFAANALDWSEAIRAGAPVLMPHPDAGRSPVHEADVAEVAWRCMTDASHSGHAYAVTGPEQLTLRQQAALIGDAIGRDVAVSKQDPDEALQQLTAWSGRPFAEAATAYWSSLANDPEEVTGDAASLIGRPTRSFAQWAIDHHEDFVTAEARRH